MFIELLQLTGVLIFIDVRSQQYRVETWQGAVEEIQIING